MSTPKARVHHYNGDADQLDDEPAASAAGEGTDETVIDTHFHATYHGHSIGDLTTVLNGLRGSNDDRGAIFLLGDSSFDNK